MDQHQKVNKVPDDAFFEGMREMCIDNDLSDLYDSMDDNQLFEFYPGVASVPGVHFKKWRKNAAGHFFQGEFDGDGKKEGRGVLVTLDSVLIGRYSNDLLDGYFTHSFDTGREEYGKACLGDKDGIIVVMYPDGTKHEEVWDMGI
jgi:hypothetical protein